MNVHSQSDTTPKLPQVLGVEDVASILGLSLAAVRRLLLRGELPGRKVGKRWRILRTRLEAFLGGERD